jgi:streptomycin 6-kinase
MTRTAWMIGLPGLVDEVRARLSLDVGSAFQPGGVASWVAPARTAAGRPVVLKLGWVHDEALHEAEALVVWDGNGAVEVLEHFQVDATSVLVLEACRPGSALADPLVPSEQDAVVAGILRRLWMNPPVGHPFRPLVEMCRWWADSSAERFARADGERLNPGLFRTGIELFRWSPSSAERPVLLSCQGPRGSPHWRPWVLPGDGRVFSPRTATGFPRGRPRVFPGGGRGLSLGGSRRVRVRRGA